MTYEPVCATCDDYGIVTLATEERNGQHLCRACLEGRLPCEHCNGAHRGECVEQLHAVVCDDCLSNLGDAQSQMRLEA